MPGGYTYSLVTTVPGEISLQVVPEPSVMGLIFVSGAIGLIWSRRQKVCS